MYLCAPLHSSIAHHIQMVAETQVSLRGERMNNMANTCGIGFIKGCSDACFSVDSPYTCHMEPTKPVTGHMLYEISRAIRQESYKMG